MRWGTGCACHGDSGSDELCQLKGRRMPEAHEYMSAKLRQGLDEANAWTPETFSSSISEWQALQGMVRATVRMSFQRFIWLERLPYVLCRLDRPGVRDLCITLWDATPPEHRDRASAEVLHPLATLRPDLEAMAPDGTGMSRRLLDFVKGMQGIPMDDSISEGPHARAKKIKDHSKACSWPWLASSLRVSQNLEDVREMVSALDLDLKDVWCRHKTVVKVKQGARTLLQPPRKREDVFRRMVYFMDFDEANHTRALGGDLSQLVGYHCKLGV